MSKIKREKTSKEELSLKESFAELKRAVSDRIYSLSVKLHRKGKDRKKTMNTTKRNELVFCFAFLAVPVCQMLIFYFGVNFNSILLSFQGYDSVEHSFYFKGFENIKKVAVFLVTDTSMHMAAKNSMLMYLSGLLIGMPLNLIFAYFIYKKIPFEGFFRVVLFLPEMVSSVVLAFVYKYAVEDFIPFLAEKLFHITDMKALTQVPQTAFWVVIFYGLWTGFGAALILYAGAMHRVPQSVIEYGQLEGISFFKEFTRVILPMIFPTITTFLVVGIAGIFTNYGALYIFYGAGARTDMWTLGYYWFTRVVDSKGAIQSYASYPEASAAGLIFTFIAAPITLLVKHLLEKYGPEAEY